MVLTLPEHPTQWVLGVHLTTPLDLAPVPRLSGIFVLRLVFVFIFPVVLRVILSLRSIHPVVLLFHAHDIIVDPKLPAPAVVNTLMVVGLVLVVQEFHESLDERIGTQAQALVLGEKNVLDVPGLPQAVEVVSGVDEVAVGVQVMHVRAAVVGVGKTRHRSFPRVGDGVLEFSVDPFL